MTLSMHINQTRVRAFQAEIINWCRAYTEHGYPLFPCGSDKRPLVKWRAAATTDHKQIEQWWRRWPSAMIGIPTGSVSGLTVLDVDRKGSVDGFATLQEHGWTIPEDAIEVQTPSGGSHFYFRYTDERNSASALGPGLDIRGEGGYVIAPPSRPVLDGDDYRFAEGQDLEMGRLA
jgi:hypothetical protein